MALTGNSSDFVSPVSDAQNPQGKLVNVGPRDPVTGLPSSSGGITSLVTKAYELMAWPALRDELIFDQFATVKPTKLSHNGAAVQFNHIDDLPDDPASALLSENYDVLPTPMKSWSHDMTMWEYGRVVTKTGLASATTMISLDPEIAERMGRSAGSTMDHLALNTLLAAGGVYEDGSAGGVPLDVTVPGSPSDTLRKAAQTFREKKIAPFIGGKFVAVITPAMETALRREADAAGWRYWQANNSAMGPGEIRNRSVGDYEGFTIIVNIRLPADQALFLGKDGLGKVFPSVAGFGSQPQMVVSPQVDRLRRFTSYGWKHLVGYGRFRAEGVMTGNLAAPAL